MLEVIDLSFSYPHNSVLEHISFHIPPRELIAIIGPNGVGKSTLFNCILGLYRRYSGSILLNALPIHSMNAELLAKNLAYVPQSHYPSFNYSVFDMVLMGTTSQVSSFSSPGQKQIRLSENALDKLGILHLRDRAYTQISGGERQLTLIARAIAQQSPLIIMDEPTANLDYGNQLRVLSRIRELIADGYTVIISTHNPDHAFLFADKAIALHNGRVAAFGAPADVITPELIKTLYGVDVTIYRAANNTYSCIPILDDE